MTYRSLTPVSDVIPLLESNRDDTRSAIPSRYTATLARLLTIKVRVTQSDRSTQCLNGAVLRATGRQRLPTVGADRRAPLQHDSLYLLD